MNGIWQDVSRESVDARVRTARLRRDHRNDDTSAIGAKQTSNRRTAPSPFGPKADIKHGRLRSKDQSLFRYASDIDHSVAGRPASSLTTLARNRSSQC